jgi:hypothetical protein
MRLFKLASIRFLLPAVVEFHAASVFPQFLQECQFFWLAGMIHAGGLSSPINAIMHGREPAMCSAIFF